MALPLAEALARTFSHAQIEGAKECARAIVETLKHSEIALHSWETVLIALAIASWVSGYAMDINDPRLATLSVRDVAPDFGKGTYTVDTLKDHPRSCILFEELQSLELMLQNFPKICLPTRPGGGWRLRDEKHVLTDCFLFVKALERAVKPDKPAKKPLMIE